jgi:hypothetical protein
MLKITSSKLLLQNLQIGKLEGTSGNLRGPSGMLEPDMWGDACAREGTLAPEGGDFRKRFSIYAAL